MSEQTAIIVANNDRFIAPVADVRTALLRYQAMKDFIKGVLNEGVDYGKIPGAGDKPTLLKPGAEKLSSFFGLQPHFILESYTEDWTGADHGGEAFFYYRYKCQLWRGETMVAEGEGSANSCEKKYRYRQAERICPNCGKPAIIKGKPEYGGGYICYDKKGGCKAKFKDGDPAIEGQQLGQVKNPDVADVVNTLQKMAQKRALIAPVLLATNASDYFTQDIEDFIDGTWQDKPAQPQQEQKTNGGADKKVYPSEKAVVEWDALATKAAELGIVVEPPDEGTTMDELREKYRTLSQAVKNFNNE